MTKKEKFKSLVSDERTDTVRRNKARIKNRAFLRESQHIALKVLNKLDELSWTQRLLAEKMGVSPQQVTKIVKGSENLTLETQIKLQNLLDIPILATYYEAVDENQGVALTGFIEDYSIPKLGELEEEETLTAKEFKMDYIADENRYEIYSNIA